MAAQKPAEKNLARKEVAMFLVLAFGLSTIFYYLVSTSAPSDELLFVSLLMFCPATAAVITRLYYQKNLKGFGLGWGKTRWQLAGIFLPILVGLVMFGCVWLTGMGPFNPESAAHMFSISFLPTFATMMVFTLATAFGEELGWRGLLVPEMSKYTSFTRMALLTGAIWTVWHFPLILFGSYHGVGPLWLSLLAFVPSVMGMNFALAWLRLKSGSVWTTVFFHGVWNYFIQSFYPRLTMQTGASELITGEFGWASPLLAVVVGLVFWHYRYLLSKSVKKD